MRSNAIPRPDLGFVAMEYALDTSHLGLIGRTMFPVFPTAVQSGKYPVVKAEAFLRLYETRRAMGAAYSRSDFEFEDKDFATTEHGHEQPLDDRRVKLFGAQFAAQLEAEQLTVKRGTEVLLRSQEKRYAALATDTSKLPHAAVSTAWTDLANADPKEDVEKASQAIEDITGLTPNVVALPKNLAKLVFKTAAFRESDKYTRNVDTLSFDAKRQVLADYFDVDRVLISNAIVDTSKPGEAALNISPIWPVDRLTVARVATNAMDLEEPCIGRTFRWTAESPTDEPVVEEYREEQIRSTIFRVRQDTAELYVFKAAAYVLTGARA